MRPRTVLKVSKNLNKGRQNRASEVNRLLKHFNKQVLIEGLQEVNLSDNGEDNMIYSQLHGT